MKKTILITTLSAIAVFFHTGPASADIRVCNVGDDEIRYVYLNEHLDIFYWGWKMKGWIILLPGDCNTVNKTIDRQRAFFSVVTVSKNNNRMLKYYPVGNIKSSSHWRDGWHGIQGIQEFFCVKPVAFERKLASPSSAKSCPAGYYKQLFNVELRTGGYTNYKLDLH